ncbi:MAG: hypothetical protein ACRC53_00025 [Plesiomonas sp.]|uniref:hypothetical protein n=1 Tax=Plesiomonas sp. TaxID=2486279 RepID=UPI003F381F02
MSDTIKKWMLRFVFVSALPLLSACAGRPTEALVRVMQPITSSTEIDDFYRQSCQTIWLTKNSVPTQQAAYWLRVAECADQIPPKSRREFAAHFSHATWHSTLKQTLLVLHASPTLIERRQSLDTLSQLREQVPYSVLPLVRIWREQQAMLINSADERIRFRREQKQYENSQQQSARQLRELNQKLQDTEQKLSRLMDIERQLSTRKQLPVKPVLSEINSSLKQPISVEDNGSEKSAIEDKIIEDKPVEKIPADVKELLPNDTEKAGQPAAGG